ncbi:siderophore-interacting protein [Rhodoferax sp.]|uniref:siderophore-interacting protein n=1 Tax=Rhodoferax sp. TaxID=50421 RepID=UPI002ACE8C5A|nr:siderophore-interacting protein [Rhodoferax sp.]MDZ7922077.1 siderophore-interacting protein [Rhodoferax sp.]
MRHHHPHFSYRHVLASTATAWAVLQAYDEMHGRSGRGGGRIQPRRPALVLLQLISDKPSHGYELIKLRQRAVDRLGGSYSPSPGTVYPTLTLLEEQGYLQGESAEAGGRKRYAITDAGKAFLEENRALTDAMLARLNGGVDGAGARGGRPPQVMRAIEIPEAGHAHAPVARSANARPSQCLCRRVGPRSPRTGENLMSTLSMPFLPRGQARTARPARALRPSRFRQLIVNRVERLTPHLVRITLAGEALAGFVSLGFDDHVKVFFPDPVTGVLAIPTAGAEGPVWPEGARPTMCDYTPHHFDPVARTLQIDFALHQLRSGLTEWRRKRKWGRPWV